MTMLIINTVEISYTSRVDYTIDEETTDIDVKIMSALPEYEKDEKKRYAIAGLLQGYFFQLMDLTEEYYDFLSVEEVEDGLVSSVMGEASQPQNRRHRQRNIEKIRFMGSPSE
ncbi:MAG: hypothetical protein IIX99_00625, partial [Oscillospiraceae bacterium]|nr:hypothetical protein [Oscillospiraceae bacterium]